MGGGEGAELLAMGFVRAATDVLVADTFDRPEAP
jgi:hypothetical protein